MSRRAPSFTVEAFRAHYTGQAELAEAIQEGLDARRSGDVRTVTARLGRAVALAVESGTEQGRRGQGR